MVWTAFAVFKLLHVVFASLWVGGVTYDWLYVTRPLARKATAEALGEYAAHADKSTPFFIVVTLGGLLTGYETARRLFGAANPVGWLNAGNTGAAIFAGLLLAVIAVVLGLSQLPPSLKKVVAARDEIGARMLFRRIQILAVVDLLVLAALLVLMVGHNTGAF